MTPRRLAIPCILIFLLLLSCVFLFFVIRQAWFVPLDESIRPAEPLANAAAATVAPKNKPTPIQQANQPSAIATPNLAPTSTPKALCGGPQVMYLLGIGADSRGDTYLYGLADVIRIARVDFVTPKITMLSIPRDLWVEIPDISDHYDITHGKLNQAYLYGNPGMGYYDGPGEGPGLLARTLEQNFGLQVDHYAAVNMQTFVHIVDALGGIDIYLEEDMDGSPVDDNTEDMGFFNAGQQHLTGEESLRLSRIRKRYSTFKREENQTLVMCAIKEKLLSPAVLPKIPQLVSAFQDNLKTDLTPAEISQLVCLLPKLSKENLLFASLPEEMFTAARQHDPLYNIYTAVLEADFNELQRYVQDFQAGTWPNQPEESSCP